MKALRAAVVGIAAAGVANASEQSELLVAKGQVAYHKRQYDEARALLEEAVAADPEDAEARYVLGLTLGQLGRWDAARAAYERAVVLRPDYSAARRGVEEATARAEGRQPPVTAEFEKVAPIDEVTRLRRPEAFKPWELHSSMGIGYDSNVTLTHDSRNATKGFVSVGGRYDVVRRPNLLLRAEYDFYNDWNDDFTEFDFQSHQPRGTASFGFRPDIWAGVQGGADFVRLGRDDYLHEPFVLPFVSYIYRDRSLTQVNYRYADGTFKQQPFENLRDGATHTWGLNQTFYWPGGRYLTLGYAYGRENPSEDFIDGPVTPTGPSTCRRNSASGDTRPCPDDFEFFFNEFAIGGGFPAWWHTIVDVVYTFHYDNYTEKNSLAGFRVKRYDNSHQFFVQVLRPITTHVRVAVTYLGTLNPSSLDIYDYNRNRVFGVLEVVY